MFGQYNPQINEIFPSRGKTMGIKNNKKITTITLLLILSSVAFLVSVDDVSAANNWTVGNGTGYNFTNITDAVESAEDGDTINIADGTYYEHDILINKNLNINGVGESTTTIDAQNLGRIFRIFSGINATITNIRFLNGNADMGGAIYNEGTLTTENCSFVGNTAKFGGVIYNNGTVIGNNSSFIGNSAYQGGAIYNCNESTFNECKFENNIADRFLSGFHDWHVFFVWATGGSIFNTGTLNIKNSNFTKSNSAILNEGNLTIVDSNFINNNCALENYGFSNIANCIFTDNTVQEKGGAIFNQGNLTIANSVFINNSSKNGGAIYNTGNLTLDNCYFENNSVIAGWNGSVFGAVSWVGDTFGGAISNEGTLIINNCIFKNNLAHGESSSLFGYGMYSYGGAIYNTGILTIYNSTFINNTANCYGGAIYNKGTLTTENCTFTNNTVAMGGAVYNTGTSEIHYCTIIGNTASQGDNIYCESPGSVNAILNWWGTNNPQEINASVVGNVTCIPWLWLIVNPNPIYIWDIVNSPFITNIITNLAPNSSEDFVQMTGNFVENSSIGTNSNNQDESQYSPDGLIIMGLTVLLGMIGLIYLLNLL